MFGLPLKSPVCLEKLIDLASPTGLENIAKALFFCILRSKSMLKHAQ